MDRQYEEATIRGRFRVYRSDTPGNYLVHLQIWPCREADETSWSHLDIRTCCHSKSGIRQWLSFSAALGTWFYGEGDEAWHEAASRMGTHFLMRLNQDLPDH